VGLPRGLELRRHRLGIELTKELGRGGVNKANGIGDHSLNALAELVAKVVGSGQGLLSLGLERHHPYDLGLMVRSELSTGASDSLSNMLLLLGLKGHALSNATLLASQLLLDLVLRIQFDLVLDHLGLKRAIQVNLAIGVGQNELVDSLLVGNLVRNGVLIGLNKAFEHGELLIHLLFGGNMALLSVFALSDGNTVQGQLLNGQGSGFGLHLKFLFTLTRDALNFGLHSSDVLLIAVVELLVGIALSRLVDLVELVELEL